MEVVQNMIGAPQNRMLKAATGLEGGCVASGATCGLVTGGSLGLGLVHAEALESGDRNSEAALLDRVGEYVKWFETAFGSQFCRECTGIDFYTLSGQARYLIPGDKVAGCLARVRGAARYLSEARDWELPVPGSFEEPATGPAYHCAGDVLKTIRQNTGLGDPYLEQASVVLDGGVGLSGGLCGALAGAVMGINLLLGLNVRNTPYSGIVRAFLTGHINLLLEETSPKREPFAVGKEVVARFKQAAGSTTCAAVTGKRFASRKDFQAHMAASSRCRMLIRHAAGLATDEIEKWKGSGK
nr:C-GCAxxG-C-C family protein [Desulfosudis oleivorans]